jgi:hypothetical protein
LVANHSPYPSLQERLTLLCSNGAAFAFQLLHFHDSIKGLGSNDPILSSHSENRFLIRHSTLDQLAYLPFGEVEKGFSLVG